MENKWIIDAHSHIGKDNAWDIEGNLNEYIKKSREIGVKESLLMPVPMPIISIGNMEITPIMLGKYGDEHFIVEGVKDQKGFRAVPVNENPYKYANEILYQKISKQKDANIRLHFVPLTHPLFDTNEYLEELINNYKPVAIKLHGYSSIISPYEINNEFWEMINQYDIPLIIHTDCDTSNAVPSIDTYYRNENSPINWIRILEKYSIRAYLTHGVRLCKESFKIVNESPNFVVGLGPDALLSKSLDRMYSKEPYFETLFSNINIDKICFDIDYPWNVLSYDNCELEWSSLDRIESLQLNENELEKVLSKNSKNFFKI